MRSTPYELELASHAAGGPEVYRFRSADGVVSKDAFRPAELLALEAVEPRLDPGDDVLVVDANYGVVPTVLAHLAGSVTATETGARAAELCRRNAGENDADVRVELLAEVAAVDDRFDVAAFAPRPYDPIPVGKARIADALGALRPGGELVVTAGKRDGGRRYREAIGGMAGEVERVGETGDVHAYRATRPAGFDPPTFVEDRVIAATVAGHDCEFVTRPGLFSPGGLDRGTELLAETVVAGTTLGPDDRVLDVACGYGPLGTALALEFDAETWLSDDSRVATACAEASAPRNGVDPEVVTADCLDGVSGPFDLVVSNPPTHAGEGVTAELFDGARRELAPGGELWLVYNETLAYEDDLARSFDAVEVVRRVDGYCVTVARME